MLTRFGFRGKMYYLCTSEEERARNTRLSPLFLPNIRDVIQEAVSKVTDTASFGMMVL